MNENKIIYALEEDEETSPPGYQAISGILCAIGVVLMFFGSTVPGVY